MQLKKCIAVVFTVVILIAKLYAVGVTEIDPNEDGIRLNFASQDGSVSFMPYGSVEIERLNVELKAGETIHFGFRFNEQGLNDALNNVFVRLVDEAGNVVVPEVEILAGQPGFINSYAEAEAGPVSLFPGGYDALNYTSNVRGTFHIEVNWRNNENNRSALMAGFYDFTVTDAGNQEQTGRVWSHRWMVRADNVNIDFFASQYIYTVDKFINRVDYNGMNPWRFMAMANSFGIQNNGNWFVDRMSENKSQGGGIADQDLVPGDFHIFYDLPDTTIFELTTVDDLFAVLTDSLRLSGCLGNYCIEVSVSKPTFANILLDLNGIPGYQANSADRWIETFLEAGYNCVEWDGLDGLGNVVSNVNLVIDMGFISGLTNFPVVDVEGNSDGFIVEYLYPVEIAGFANTFWDDTQIGGQNNSIFPCVPGPGNGCHRWDPNWGDEDFINTWWYLLSDPIAGELNVPPITLQIEPVSPVCPGDSVQLVATQGFVNYTWTPDNELSATDIHNPWASPDITTMYYLTVSTDQGCEIQDSVEVVINPLPVVTATPDPEHVCEGESTTVAFDGADTYTWLDNSTAPNPFTFVPTADTTSMSVIGTSVDGCVDTTSFTVYKHPLPTPLINNPGPVCSGQSDTIFVSGAGNGGTYVWDPDNLNFLNDSTAIITPTVNTTYTVEVSTIYGCNGSVSTSVAIIDPPVLSISPDKDKCEGDTAHIILSGYQSGMNLSWSNTNHIISINGDSTILIVEPPVGQHIYTANVDINGFCQATASITIDIHPAPVPGISPNDTICEGESSILTATGGTSYQWNPTNFLFPATGDVATVTATPDVGSHLYNVTIKNAFGCEADTSVQVVVHPNVSPAIDLNNPLITCGPSETTISALNINNEGNNPTYTWFTKEPGQTDFTLVNNNNSTSLIIPEPVDSMLIRVLLTSDAYCVDPDTVSASTLLKVAPVPAPYLLAPPVICPGQTIDEITVADSNNLQGVSYDWFFSDNNTGDYVFLDSLSGLNQHTLINWGLDGELFVVATREPCSQTSNTIRIDYSLIDVRAAVSPPIILEGELAQLIASSTTADSAIVWLQQELDSAQIIYSGEFKDSIYHVPPESQRYYLVGINKQGCRDTAFANIIVLPPIIIPNVITPNGDGLNDIWRIKNLEYYINAITKVYNRWGTVVYQHKGGATMLFDGISTRSAPLPVGTYYFEIDLRFRNLKYAGDLTILR